MARKILTEADIQKRKRGVIIGVASGCVGILVLVGIVALVAYLRITAKPPPPPEARIAAQAPQQPVQSLDQQVRDIRRQARPGAVQPVQIVATSQELTAAFSRSLQGNDVQDLQVHLGEGTAAVQAKVKAEGREVWVTLRLRPRADNGQARLDLVDARVGTMAMPDGMRTKLQQEIDKQPLGRQLGAGGMWVDAISISQGRLYLQGRVRGR